MSAGLPAKTIEEVEAENRALSRRIAGMQEAIDKNYMAERAAHVERAKRSPDCGRCVSIVSTRGEGLFDRRHARHCVNRYPCEIAGCDEEGAIVLTTRDDGGARALCSPHFGQVYDVEAARAGEHEARELAARVNRESEATIAEAREECQKQVQAALAERDLARRLYDRLEAAVARLERLHPMPMDP